MDKDKLSNDIRDWSFQVAEDKLVVFEEYSNTIKRMEKPEEYESYSDEEDDFALKIKELAVYNSSVGPVMVPEFSDPTKYFKLWTMYSKIPLTRNLLIKIENTKGIETIEALSPYRARVGIAPLFKDRPILNNITEIIQNSTLSDLEK